MKISFSGGKTSQKGRAVFSFQKQKIDEVVIDDKGQKKIIVGVEKPKAVDLRKLVLLSRKMVYLAKAHRLKKIAVVWNDLLFSKVKLPEEELAEFLATNWAMADYEFIRYKEKPKEGWNFVDEVVVMGVSAKKVKDGFKRGLVVAHYVNFCRDLVNTPGGEMTPGLLVRKVRKELSGTQVRLKVMGKKEMEKLGMNSILSVAKGSKEEPRLLVIHYNKGEGKEKPVVLVGKGVTFDSGGVNLKSSDGLKDMQMDMAGGAAVIATMALAAKLKLKRNIVGIVPLVENMLSGESYRPGDIIKTMSGKTIEVLNTDAEGRVILADALTYAGKFKPRLVIDVATLTGASIVALGYRASALFTKSEKHQELFRNWGEKAGDFVWPLPLWEEYEEELKGTFGDIINTGKYSREGGAITAAAFLYQFAKKYPWVHIDIAPKMTAVEGEYLAKGAAGAPVRLLFKVLGPKGL